MSFPLGVSLRGAGPLPCSPASASFLYPSDLTDAEWARLAPRPAAPLGATAAAQRHLLRPAHWLCLALSPAGVSAVGNGVYNIPRWRLQGVWQCMHEALRRAVRRRAGRDPAPSAAIMDSQRGPKRHLLVDTPRLLLSVYIIPANNNLRPRGAAPLADRAQAVAAQFGAHLSG